MPEQRRIIQSLNAVAAGIEARTREVTTIEAELAKTLRAGFHKIAAGAPHVRMGDVAPIVRRAVEIDPDETYTELGVRSFYKGTFHRRTVNGAEFTWQKLFRIHQGDLVFSNLMAWEQAIAVAQDV